MKILLFIAIVWASFFMGPLSARELEPLSTHDIAAIVKVLNDFGKWATSNLPYDDSLLASSVFNDHGVILGDVWFPGYSLSALRSSGELIRQGSLAKLFYALCNYILYFILVRCLGG